MKKIIRNILSANKKSRHLLGVLFLLAFIVLGIKQMAQEGPAGALRVAAPSDGIYEVYRIESESPLQFVSEQIGQFNKDLTLAPGSYLILADCSSYQVIIHPKKTETIVSHDVTFVPPRDPDATDKFSLQCNRYAETRSRQHVTNRYRFHILQGKRDLLVGMVPMTIDFDSMPDPHQPKELTYNLSALQVSAYEDMKAETSYFVSPTGGMMAVTEPQLFGQWQYLLPGAYQIEVNGTRMEVSLQEGEQRIIPPAFLKISSPPDVDLELSSQISGNPVYIQLNQDHWLNLDEVYPVLPGLATLRVNGSQEPYEVTLTEGKVTEKTARSVLIHSDCSPWEWSCLGNTPVFIYEQDKLYPFTEGVTDVPLLFLKETDVWVSLQGSRDIRYKIPQKQQSIDLRMGKIKFNPSYTHKVGLITDLARVEAVNLPFTGETLDIQLERESEMPVIAGTYFFTQYISLTSIEGERRKKRDYITVRPNKTTDIEFTVYLSEKRLAQIDKERKQHEAYHERRAISRYKNRFHPAISPKYQ